MGNDLWEAPPGDKIRRGRWRFALIALSILLVAGGFVTNYVLTRTEGSRLPAGQSSNSDQPEARSTVDPGQRVVEAAGGLGPDPLIDPDDLVSGGLPPDGIPPIDDPKFMDVSQVDWLTPREPVISVVVDDDARAYPLQVMTWHEIANDVVGDLPISVTFCPLCNTAYAFEQPTVKGEPTTMGTSGMLYHSNLIMYDRATSSLWPQALGQAVIGPLTGKTLERVPAQIVAWEEFRSAFPEGIVLSRDTGFERSYGDNPYPGYDDVDNPPFLFSGEVDGRLAAVDRILGVESGGEITAFPYSNLQDAAVGEVAAVNTSVGGQPIVVLWKEGTVSALDKSEISSSKDVGAAAAFSRRLGGRTLTFTVRDGVIVDTQTSTKWNLLGRAVSGPLSGKNLEPADAHDSFWFDWAAFHPDTEVWAGG